ncbi:MULTISPECIES: hypothetical protein [unclassified Anabaena]
MTRKPHDQFAKQFLEELLSPLGKVEANKEVIIVPASWCVLFKYSRTNPK